MFDVGDGALCAVPAFTRAVEKPWSDELRSVMTKAADLFIEQEISLLGKAWPASNAEQFQQGSYWHFDPVTGSFWPGAEKFCFDVNYRHAVNKGDVKFVWELNRLQFLQPAALLAAKDGNLRLNRQVLDTVLNWMDANPPFSGVNWNSGIEVALRLVSLAVVISSSKTGMMDSYTRKRLRAFVAAHAYWLARFPSLFSSANNHRVAEGLGLVIAATLVPDLPQAKYYLSEGASIIRDAPMSQFFADGVGAEQSPTYSAFTLEMIAVAQTVMGSDTQSPSFHQKLSKATHYLHLILDRNGVCPRIGDDDEGRVLAIAPVREDRYVASITASLSGFLCEPELCPASRDIHWRDLLFDSPMRGAQPRDGVTSFPEGGYTVVREKIGARNILLVVDHGPLGFLSIAAHGHADALALWLHIDEIPVFVDAGTYLYHSGGPWRDHFRTTRAHSTLELEGQSQSLTAGSFNWKHKAEAWLEEAGGGPAWRVTARHNGYTARLGVDHERTIQRAEEGFMIVDRLHGRSDRALSAKVSFLVNPILKPVRDRSDVVIYHEDRPLVRLWSPPCNKLEINADGIDGSKAFYSPAFGVKVPAPTISVVPFLPSSEIVTHLEVVPRALAGDPYMRRSCTDDIDRVAR
jgi:hypothetical protein